MNDAIDMETAELEARMGIGGNNPPTDEATLFVNQLYARNVDIVDRAAAMIEAADRAPKQCDDEENAKKLTDMVAILNASKKELEASRKDEKEPFRRKADAVQNYFMGFMEQIDTKVKELTKPLSDHLKRKADKARQDAEAEAKRAREEAERLQAMAQQHEQNHQDGAARTAIDNAVVAEERAEAAEKVAAAKPAALASSRGNLGSRSGLVTAWVGTIEDRTALDLEALRPYFNLDDLQKALNGYVKANCKGDTGSTLKGAKIEQQSTARVRG